MAGPDFLYEGIFKQAGIIRVHSIEDLYSHGWALSTQPPLQGKRIGIVTNSGGPGTAISHNVDLGGLEVPRYSEELQSQIRPLIPPHASSANPIDLTFYLDMQILSTVIPEMIMRSGESGRPDPARCDDVRFHERSLPPCAGTAEQHF